MQNELFPDDDENQETVDDVHASQSDLSNAVLFHTDWTVETIVGQIKRAGLICRPIFSVGKLGL